MAGTNGNGEYIRIDKGYLEIRQKLGPGTRSMSGKSLTLVSTGGFTSVPESDVRVNVIAIKKS